MHFHRLARVCAALAFALVVGRITDKTTGQPLPGIDVLMVQPGSAHHAPHTYTDADGNYRLRNVPPGRYQVTISSDDVPAAVFTTTVGAHEKTHRLDLVACSVTLDYSCSH